MDRSSPHSAYQAFDWLDSRSAARDRMGLTRSLRPREATSALIDAAGNDYLGLARHPIVCRAAADAAIKWGAGSTGSRLVSGTTKLHEDLERELAEFCGTEAALVFSSGYMANIGAITGLCGPDSAIVADKNNHASLVTGCHLSAAELTTVAHNDVAAVDSALDESGRGRGLVVTESIFSVDGDIAPLPGLVAVARRHGAALIVDDAHGLGVVGPGGIGAAAALGLPAAPDVVTVVTLSKALGSQGGAVLGPDRVIRHLISGAPPFLFDTALAPSCAAAALTALRILRDEPERASRVLANSRQLFERFKAADLPVAEPEGAIVSMRAPSPQAAVAWASACRDAGVAVGCFRPPAVPDRISRLRVTVRADLEPGDLDVIVDTIVRTAPKRD